MASGFPYVVLKDTREQKGWDFPRSERCGGTEAATLKTGDYTLQGYEDAFVIERKGSTAELSQNVCDKRFDRELDRLDAFKYPFLVLEFDLADVVNFPNNSGIPKSRWRQLRVTPQFLLCRLQEIQVLHPLLNIVYAGQNGREYASSLFKRIVENA